MRNKCVMPETPQAKEAKESKEEIKYNEAKDGYSSWLFVILVILSALLLFNGCKTITQYEKVYTHTTDTIYQNVLQKDSVYVHDSITVKMLGDTVYKDRWRTKYTEKLLRDTVYKSKVDSVYVDVIKEKSLSRKERRKMFLMDLGIFVLVTVFVIIAFKVIKYIKGGR